jgi:hypothetical protein
MVCSVLICLVGKRSIKKSDAQGDLVSSVLRELAVIVGIESFEVTIIICLLLTGFEGKQGTVGVV